jgi:serine phosphatase RsbU (regulator of sigma subunit)
MLRTLAEYTGSPAEILRGLNRRLIGRMRGGFATCVILRIAANGEAIVANAGHFAPFHDSKEVMMSGSLPLGIIDEAVYDETEFALREHETLTFYTDGVLEARNARGEFFGFERLRELLRVDFSPEGIVDEVCAFGQDDDITVLTLTRLAASEPAQAAVMDLSTRVA